MIKNLFVTAYRNLFKSVFFSAINIFGLSIGIASFILISMYIREELSYDNFHEKADRIYRIAAYGSIGNTEIHQTHTNAPLAFTLIQEYPEVEQAVRLCDLGKMIIRVEDRDYSDFNLMLADSTFFDVFTFPMLSGNPQMALTEPNSVVLTESTAHKIFGNEDPVNQTLELTGWMNLKITGVIKDMPQNSHFHTDILCSFNSWKDYIAQKNWWNNSNQTYIVMQKGTDVQGFEQKLPDFIRRHLFETEKQYEEFTVGSNAWSYKLQHLPRIHLTSHLNGEFDPNGNMGYIYIFSVAAVFILIIACINFMNLTTAKSAMRFKEIGIRKVAGATRHHLILQFLLESITITLLSGILSIVLIYFSLPWFNQLSSRQYTLPFSDIRFDLQILGVLLVTGIIAGSYPAFFLSSIVPSSVLKSAVQRDAKGINFRSVLVIIQFIISAFMIAGTFGVYKQLHYMTDVDLGYNKENVVILKRIGYLKAEQVEAFRHELMQNPNIKSTSLSNTVPMGGLPNWGCTPENISDQSITLNSIVCDADFALTYDLKMVKGRFFSGDFPTDSTGIVINEQTQKLMRWKESVGKKIFFGENIEYHVIGVVKNFHYEPLYQSIRPGALFIKAPWGSDISLLSVKLSGEDVTSTMQTIEKKWKKFSNLSMEYSFFDQDYDKIYQNERRTSRTMTAFSILAIIIASLGLLGRSSFITEQKTKEIGIRKVHGAGIPGLVLLLSYRFLRWVIIAGVIAIPLSVMAFSEWLSNFAYRIPISIYPYLLTLLIILAIALITVIFQVVSKAMSNPVKALRYE